MCKEDTPVEDLRSIRAAIEGAKGYLKAVISDTENPNAFARREKDILDRIAYLNNSLSKMRDHRDNGPAILTRYRNRLKTLRSAEASVVNKVKIAQLQRIAMQLKELEEEDVDDVNT